MSLLRLSVSHYFDDIVVKLEEKEALMAKLPHLHAGTDSHIAIVYSCNHTLLL